MKAWKKWLIAVFSIVLVAGIAIGTVWLVNNWDALTSDTTLYTQKDIDDAYEQGLNDAGYEVILQYQEQIAIIQGQLEESQIKVGNLTDSLNQALEQNKIDAEAIAGYLDDITELNNTITDLNKQIKLYQELLEAYENSGKFEVIFYLVENGEQTPYDAQVVEPNGYLSAVVEPEGDFEGWSLTIGGELIDDLTEIQITEDTNIYGTFYQTVTFMVNDEEYSTQQVGYNKYATEPEEPTKYYIESWTLNGENITLSEYPITQDITFIANLTYPLTTLNQFISENQGVSGSSIWTDGENFYYSIDNIQYKLNSKTLIWESKVWNVDNINGSYVWTDNDKVYYSNGEEQYILNKETSTWEIKVWYGLTDFNGDNVWTDDEEVYYSYFGDNYILNKETSTWEEKIWNGFTDLYTPCIWRDGDSVYYSNGESHYKLNKETSTWEEKNWNGITLLYGNEIWTDGRYVYYSNFDEQYILNRETDTWEEKVWYGFSDFNGSRIWTDGENFYYSEGINQYIIV